MAISVDALSESDLKRFAACWLSCDRTTVDWTAAAAVYDANAKWESFRTVTSKAANKHLKSNGGEGGASTPKPKKAAAGKRKKAASEDGADEEEAPKPKKGKLSRAKKAKSEEKIASDAEEDAVKAKEEGEASD